MCYETTVTVNGQRINVRESCDSAGRIKMSSPAGEHVGQWDYDRKKLTADNAPAEVVEAVERKLVAAGF